MDNVNSNLRKSRKRVRNSDNWARNVAKKLRNSGAEYINRSNNIVPKKKFENKDCGCQKKCKDVIDEDIRKNHFDNFWKMGSFETQNAYLCGCVQSMPIKRRRPRDGSRCMKSSSNVYCLSNVGDSTIVVCKKYFLQTFAISEGRLNRAIMKHAEGKCAGSDDRGKASNPHKLSNDIVKNVCDHIQSFPAYVSHYTRKHNPDRKYLNENLNVRKMYMLYKEKCSELNILPVKEHMYRHIFNTRFNLHFKKPRKDTCKKCDEYKVKLDASGDQEAIQNLKDEHALHLLNAEEARNSMKEDAEKAKCSDNVYVCSIDLQKALPFPILTVSDAYYKRNMYCYNLGIHDLRENIGFFYVWDETIASRGSQEIASCLIKHIKTVAGNKEKIIIYSDTCPGQNRNIKLALSLLKLVQSDIITTNVIEQKFLVSGHSFLPNDSDFGSVESAARHSTIYVPEDWYRCMKTARYFNKFRVCEMKRNEFFSTKQLERSITKRNRNTLTQTVNWLTIQWLHYERGKQFDIFYKTTISPDIEFHTLNIQRARCGRPLHLKTIQQENLYPSVRPVSAAKKKDMLDMLKFIPPIHHRFFQELKTSATEEDDDESSNE